jgi:AcrR family transcriptional regulator
MAISNEKSKELKIQRREQILNTSLILFDEKGYSNTRVSDIAEKVGISKSLVFKYFPRKIDIFIAITELIESCLADVFNGPTPTDSLKNFAIKLTSMSDDYIPPMRLYIATFIRGELPIDMQENFLRHDFAKKRLTPIIIEGQESGEFREGDPQELADAYWLYLLGAVANHIQNRPKAARIPNPDIPLKMLKSDKGCKNL